MKAEAVRAGLIYGDTGSGVLHEGCDHNILAIHRHIVIPRNVSS